MFPAWVIENGLRAYNKLIRKVAKMANLNDERELDESAE